MLFQIDVTACFERMSKEYKFYLAFENSFCNEYVTEKFFRVFNTKMSLVPIVMGAANYSKIAPQHSYINVKDFKSPKHLANYIKYLISNEDAYLDYFWWRMFYSLGPLVKDRNTAVCQMCQMLHEGKVRSKSYDMMSWWRGKNQCLSPYAVDW